MKKILLLAVLFASFTCFAGGKPATISLSQVVKGQKESVLKPVFFTSCYHKSGSYQFKYQAEADLAGWKSVMKQYAIIDQSDVYENDNLEWESYAIYTPGSGVCNRGDMVCTWCASIDNSPQLQIKSNEESTSL